MAKDNPAHIARLMRAEEIGFGRGVARSKNLLDAAHGADQLPPIGVRDRRDHLPDLLVGTLFERTKRGGAFGGQGQVGLAAIGSRGLAINPAAFFEAGKNAAEITGIDAELGGEPGGGNASMRRMRDLVEQTYFGQRERGGEQPLLEEADLAGIETVEVANGGDGILDGLRDLGLGTMGDTARVAMRTGCAG